MKTKRFLYCSAILSTVFLTAVTGIGAQEYTGVVIPTATSVYSYVTFTDIYGNYSYIARPGEIITPQVSDNNGNVVKPGNLLIQNDPRYWVAVLAQMKSSFLTAKRNLYLSEIAQMRCQKLYQTNSGSYQDYLTAQNGYQNARIAYANAEAAYKQFQFQIDCYNQYATFEGIVTKNTGVIGATTGGAPVIAVSQLNPIGIEVKMDRNAAKAIGNNTPVKIYPLNADKPQGVIYGLTAITDDGIEFVTENYPTVEGATVIQDDSCLVLRNWLPVRKFYADKNPEVLAIPAGSIVKDGDKSFVWRAKGQKTMQPNKGIDRYFQIEKVYVDPADMLRIVDNFEKKIALNSNGSLGLYDLVLKNPPDGLVDGQTVLYPEGSYLLMPGDQVKVVVGN